MYCDVYLFSYQLSKPLVFDWTAGENRCDGADDRAAEGDEPEGVKHHLDGRRHKPFVDHAPQHLQHVAVLHLGDLAVGINGGLTLLVHVSWPDILQYQVNDKARDHCAQDEQHDAQHPQSRMLGKTLVLDELLSLKTVDHDGGTHQQDHENITQRRELVGKDGRHGCARHVQAERDTPLAGSLVDALFRCCCHIKLQN